MVLVKRLSAWLKTLVTSLVDRIYSLLAGVYNYGLPFDSNNQSMRTSTVERYEPFRKHVELFGNTFHEEWLHPDMIQIMEKIQPRDHPINDTSLSTDNGTKFDPATLSPYLNVEMPGLYSFNCFNEQFIHLFMDELNHFYQMSEERNIPVRRPNSMNNYGVIVNEIGMQALITSFQQNYIWPLSKRLFPVEGSQFDDHHAFMVRYRANEDLGLDMHTDDSDVTLNVCMGDDGFTGATLVFCGMFGAPDHRKEHHTYHHQMGRAVLHLGNRRHGAEDITSGSRTNLIVWNHNYEY